MARAGHAGWTASARSIRRNRLPVAVGLLVAGVVGTAMGNALLGLVGRTADVDRLNMPEIAGIGAARVLLVTVPTAPAPRRTTRPEGLRTD